VTPEGDQCVISAQTLKPVKQRKGAHMTFATAVAFAPDDSAIVSTSADASATLTTLSTAGAVPGGGATFIVMLALLFLVLAVLAGMLRRLAEEHPADALATVQWLPEWMQQLIITQKS